MDKPENNATIDDTQIGASFATSNSINITDNQVPSSGIISGESTDSSAQQNDDDDTNRAFNSVDSLKGNDPESIVTNSSPIENNTITTVNTVAISHSPAKTQMDQLISSDIPMPIQVQNKFTHLGIEVDHSQPDWHGEPPGDLQFTVQDRVFTVSKHLLTQRSLLFTQLFRQYPTANRFTLLDVDPNVFDAFLAFVQENKRDSLEQYTQGLLAAAYKFSVPSLKNRCEEILLKRPITRETAIDLLLLADINEATKFREKVEDYIVEQYPSIVDMEEFERVTRYKPRLAIQIFKAAKSVEQ